jgi:hypothetical protein
MKIFAIGLLIFFVSSSSLPTEHSDELAVNKLKIRRPGKQYIKDYYFKNYKLNALMYC